MSSIVLTVNPHVPTSDRLMVEFDKALTAFDAHTPLTLFRWEQGATPTIYDYVIKAVDGRTWTQKYDYADPAVPPVELPTAKTTSDGWSVKEIDLHRAVRKVLLLIVATHSVTLLRAVLT